MSILIISGPASALRQEGKKSHPDWKEEVRLSVHRHDYQTENLQNLQKSIRIKEWVW